MSNRCWAPGQPSRSPGPWRDPQPVVGRGGRGVKDPSHAHPSLPCLCSRPRGGRGTRQPESLFTDPAGTKAKKEGRKHSQKQTRREFPGAQGERRRLGRAGMWVRYPARHRALGIQKLRLWSQLWLRSDPWPGNYPWPHTHTHTHQKKLPEKSRNVGNKWPGQEH